MYRVVIVDDEEIIANGLKTILPWEKYNCQVAGIAYNGESGLELIRRERPDILFTDIRMPGMDGLTMVAALKSEFPRLQISVLTGFRDFEYAQTAIKLGVCRFLLKPSKMEELYEALEAMTAALGNLPAPASAPEAPEGDPEDEAAVEAAVAREEAPAEDSVDSRTHSFVVKRALSYIETHYAERMSLADVADTCYISQWHLSKLLKRYTNQSFYDLVNNARIRAAKELLKDPALRIRDISDKVGFTDTAHFAKIFKKVEGCSANEYRNNLQ